MSEMNTDEDVARSTFLIVGHRPSQGRGDSGCTPHPLLRPSPSRSPIRRPSLARPRPPAGCNSSGGNGRSCKLNARRRQARPRRTNITRFLPSPSSFPPAATKASAAAVGRICSLGPSSGPPLRLPRPLFPSPERERKREGLEGGKGHLFHSLARSK